MTSKNEPELDEFGGTIGQGQVRTIRAPWGPSTVTRVRKAVVADLRARDLDEQTIDESEIVVSELMTNAIRHARPLQDGCLRVRWKVRGEVVEIEVTDGGGEKTPLPAPAAVWLTSGRGLRIVRSLAHEWGVGEDKGAQVVWAAMGGPSRRRAT
ncbi:ATP-binding protein [Knoellia sp. CPCC 206450]|uniref:ATP-binding protein n=1 Tax=Knoellia tibetensis TaxID=3404798 RepID=UPI003B42E547